MPVVSIGPFSGLSPRTGTALLQDNQAQIASNVKLQSGELRPWRAELEVEAAETGSAMTIYKMTGPSSASQWLSWATDVDVVASPLADTSDYRIYYTGDGLPKKTNWTLSETGLGAHPRSWYYMGVPAPAGAPTLSSSGGSTVEERAYVYTYVSTFGSITEESAPSPAATVNSMATGATVTVNGFAAAPTSGYNITHIRIYRAVTGATTTVYKQVAEIPIATTTYDDTKTVVQLGSTLESTFYNEPPDDLTGIVSMANGILAGFSGNSVYFSEPWLPHAWPATYVVNTEFPIVGLGAFGTTLVVCTTKNPYLITGTHPATMTQEKLSITQACVAKRSIAFDQNGVLYASPYGLVSIGPGSQDVITTPLMTNDEWQDLNPTTMISALYGNYYMGFYNNGNREAIILARGDSPPLTTLDFPANAVYVDRGTGSIYALNSTDNKIYQLDADESNNTTYEWRSKRFVYPKPINFACIQANADFAALDDATEYLAELAEANAANAATFSAAVSGDDPLYGEWNEAIFDTYLWNESSMVVPPAAIDVRVINVIVYADGAQVYTADINSIRPRRMPSGFKAYSWEIVITGNIAVRSVAMATSMGEIAFV